MAPMTVNFVSPGSSAGDSDGGAPCRHELTPRRKEQPRMHLVDKVEGTPSGNTGEKHCVSPQVPAWVPPGQQARTTTWLFFNPRQWIGALEWRTLGCRACCPKNNGYCAEGFRTQIDAAPRRFIPCGVAETVIMKTSQPARMSGSADHAASASLDTARGAIFSFSEARTVESARAIFARSRLGSRLAGQQRKHADVDHQDLAFYDAGPGRRENPALRAVFTPVTS